MVSAQDLVNIANGYFLEYGRIPKTPVTRWAADQFAWNSYRLILAMPSDPNAGNQLVLYLYNVCKHYGADPGEVMEYFKQNPHWIQAYISYCHENFEIEKNAEILKRLVNDAFSFVGSAVAGALGSFLKPFLMIGLVIAAGYLGFKYANKKVSQ